MLILRKAPWLADPKNQAQLQLLRLGMLAFWVAAADYNIHKRKKYHG